MTRRRPPHRPSDRCYPALDERVTARFVRLRSGLQVRVVECGPRGGKPVLLLPGWAVSAYTYRHQLPALGAAGYRATAIDLKGHGFSDKPTGPGEYTLAAMVRHVEEVAEAVAPGPAVLIAQSMSGRLGVELALSRTEKVSALVLVSPVGFGVVPFIRLARLLTPRILDPIAPRLVRRWVVRMGLHLAYGRSERVTEDAVEEYWAPAQFAGFARALRGLVHDFDWSPLRAAQVAELDLPTLIVRGSLDRLVRGPPRHPAPLGRARLVVIDDAGHALNEERSDAANTAILEFLGGQPQ